MAGTVVTRSQSTNGKGTSLRRGNRLSQIVDELIQDEQNVLTVPSGGVGGGSRGRGSGSISSSVSMGRSPAVKREKNKKEKRNRRYSYIKAIDEDDEDDESNTHWIRDNLRLRACNQFVLHKKADESDNNPKCGCGLKKIEHQQRYRRDIGEPKGSWSVNKYTKTAQTNAFGDIEFVGGKSGSALGQKGKKFVRVDHTTSTENLLHLLNKEWHLNSPKLLISVTGGALNFNLNSRLRDVFRKGIIKAAVSTGAWIITGGTHAGVMKYVGEAVRDYQLANSRTNVVAIGIATWGILDQREELQSDVGKFPAYMNTKRQDPDPAHPAILLDPNHTHFILVDDGRTHEFGAEIDLRARLERGISTQKVEADTQVPVVCVVVEGGPNTIETAAAAVSKDTPIVVVANSGRAADVIAFAIQHARPVDKEKKVLALSDKNRVKIAQMLLAMNIKENQLDQKQQLIDNCLKKPHLLNVYEQGSGLDIDASILNALMTANQGKRQDQLRLSQAWNRVDIAKQQLFGPDSDWQDNELTAAMHHALVNNQVEFVRLFLENGLSLKSFLTVDELTSLYNDRVNAGSVLQILFANKLKNKLKKKASKTQQEKMMQVQVSLQDVGKVIKSLTMDTYYPKYFDKKYQSKTESQQMVEDNGNTTNGKNGVKRDQTGSVRVVKPDFKDPIRELFIFAILNKFDEMAHLFWEEGTNMIAAALTASLMLKNMESTCRTRDVELKENLSELSSEFEHLATGVLNECFSEDERRTSYILIRELPNWGRVTCLSLAVAAENQYFIAQSGVQSLLTEIWQGKLSNDNNSFMLWACTFMPLLIPWAVTFREDEDDDNNDNEPQKTANQNGDQQPNTKDTTVTVGNDEVFVESVQMTHQPIKRDDSEEVAEEDPKGLSTVRLLTPGAKGDDYEATGDVDISDSGKDLTLTQRIVLFYDSPKITFRHNVLSYFAFLALFSFIMLSNKFTTPKPSIAEYVLMAWVFTLFVEEFRQLAQGDSQSWRVRGKDWFFDRWNQVDLATIVLFATGIVLRFFDNPKVLDAARIVLALDLFIFFLRLLNIFTLFRNIGPKLVMIARMFVDLSFFFCILFVFLLAYGITAQSILYPHVTDGGDIIMGIFYRPYFQIYGELFLEDLSDAEGDCSNTDPDLPPCPTYPQIGIILLAGYMVLSNVLLLNLLIAMFSYTFEKVQENTDLHWKFQRYALIKEYFNRPPLVPPLIIISHLVFFIRFLAHKCGLLKGWKHGQLKQKLDKPMVKKLVRWESFMAEEYITEKHQREQLDINEQVRSTGDRVDDLLVKMEQVFADPETGIPSKSLGLLGEKVLQERLNKLEDQLDRTNEAVDWIITALTDNKLSAKRGLPELKDIKPREEADEELETDEVQTVVPTSLEELGIMVHVKARSSPYPSSAQERCNVPTAKVAWEVEFPGYKPTNYTHETVLKQPGWADVDLLSQPESRRPQLMFNKMDTECKYDRQSYMGNYEIVNGLPRNPRGRTGMIGRGLLGRFGPNHAADPIVTRWKRKPNGEIIKEYNDKPILEFVSIQRKDNQQWAIPGGMVEAGDTVSATISREFSEEALNSMELSGEELKEAVAKVEAFFKNGTEVYRGYVDDPRNTDNAWMETVAMNFHDESGTSVGQLQLHAGDDAQGVQWQNISGSIPLFASHTAMLKKVAELHGAYF